MISCYRSHLPARGGTSGSDTAAGRARTGCGRAPGHAGGRIAARGTRPQPPRQEVAREPTWGQQRRTHVGTTLHPLGARAQRQPSPSWEEALAHSALQRKGRALWFSKHKTITCNTQRPCGKSETLSSHQDRQLCPAGHTTTP